MRTTIAPIYKEFKTKIYQRQIQLPLERKTTSIPSSSSGNWKIISYQTLKSLYKYYEWSKKRMLKDSSYANQKDYLILKEGWNPQRDAGSDRAFIYKYHRFDKDPPIGQRFRILKLEGKSALIEIQEKQGSNWKRIYVREINLD